MNNDKILSLCETYKDYFKIGAAVRVEDLEGIHGELLKKHFNSVTLENAMKFGEIQPVEGRFEFDKPDKIKEFAINNNIKMRGHTFVWHNQTPSWLFVDKNGNQVSRELLLNRLKQHIKTLVNRYGDIIYAWDVVNEAIEDKTGEQYRDTPWRRILGENYIKIAFEVAKEEINNAELYYNDYNNEIPNKLDKSYRMLKELIEKGTPIDGVGIQAHWNITDKKLIDNLKNAIEKYASLGLKIQITELDVSMFNFENSRTDLLEPTSEMLYLQEEMYDNIFRTFREYKEVINSVTFWGISDMYTWKDNFPVPGRKDWPMLFDVKGKPKRAFDRVVNFK
ncbi:endo-1,4-beta-xylanase [Clostridium sp. USBA 49]|jgi:endo-1,4-beta-xylanase|uniref:endo-1,4-beta-xylanase n=1 Tax=Clostridium TaxID=1485 RepID=UPI000999401F|nr:MULTISPECIES: endo-1,4-beta-xylanase [Clostridium]SKA74205.1 endo-1,4-beta-xylanase [Clostridium sp. USBA 49]